MLGRLAKYLRILGIDTEYSTSRDFAYKLHIAQETERVFLTRNTAIFNRRESPLFQFIKSNFPEYQLIEVIETQNLRIQESDILRRCLRCNTPIVSVDKESVRTRVPEYVYNTQDSFSTCPNCKCIYWQGTHYKRLKKFSESVKKLIG